MTALASSSYIVFHTHCIHCIHLAFCILGMKALVQENLSFTLHKINCLKLVTLVCVCVCVCVRHLTLHP